MALKDFFAINLPYGLKINDQGEWFVFNREFLPLGWNAKEGNKEFYGDRAFLKFPVYTKYTDLTESAILKIITDPNNVHRDGNGKIIMISFYNGETNPQINPQYWDDYLNIIMAFSTFETFK